MPWYSDPLVLDALVYKGLQPRDIAWRTGTSHSYCDDDALWHYQNRVQRTLLYKEKLKGLLEGCRGITQRTEEWYAARKMLITASDAAQALGEGKFGTQYDFFEKKLELKQINFNVPPLQWGVKYEPVATYVYEYMFGVVVHEFGLLKHPVHSFIGASPDGINEYGIMVEIKCPYRRMIDGTVPDQYYTQMQLQLDVCDLDECDYFECEIDELEQADFETAASASGALLGGTVRNGEAYEYRFCFGKDRMDAEEMTSWVTQGGGTYWVLRRHNVVRVMRDPKFIQDKVERLEQVYLQLLGYMQDPESFVSKEPRMRKKREEPCLFD